MTTTATSLRIERVFKAKPEQVFDAFAKPEKMMKWSCPHESGPGDVQMDFRIGGRYSITMPNPDGGTITASGEYKLIDPPKRLQYSWTWDSPGWEGRESLVDLTFEPHEDGTKLTLNHTELLDEDAVKGHALGWEECFEHLAKFVES